MVVRKPSLLNWSNIAALILVVIVNGLAGSTTLIGGRTTADVSNAYPTLITPAGYVFAIWGVIYFLLGVFVVYQILPENRSKSFRYKIGGLFVFSSALNVLWLFAWQYELLGVSVIIMVLLLLTLILIYTHLEIGVKKVSLGERLAVQLPFSVYLGWITIATIANVAAALVSVNWNGFGMSAESWTVVVIIIATLIAVLVAVTRRDIAYELVIIWAFVGIAVNQITNQILVITLMICTAAVIIALVASWNYVRTLPKTITAR